MIGAPLYQYATVESYIEEVIEYMVSSGVDREVAVSRKCIGTVTRGVTDLWNYNSGQTDFSAYFKERVTQLAYGRCGNSTTPHERCVDPIAVEEIEKILEK